MLGTWPSTLRKVNHSLHCLKINRQVIFLQGELCSEGHQIQKLEQSWSWLISSTSPCTTAVPPDISVSLSPPAQWRTNIPHTVLLNGTLDFDRLRTFGWCRSFRPTREKCWTLKYPPILKWESKDKNQHGRARPTPNFYWNSASRHHKRVGGQYSRTFFGLAQAPIMELQEICHTTPGISERWHCTTGCKHMKAIIWNRSAAPQGCPGTCSRHFWRKNKNKEKVFLTFVSCLIRLLW